MNPRMVVALVTVVLLAGCTGGAFSYSASPATVDEAAAEDAGYVGEGPEEFTINESVEVAGLSRDVQATTWTAGYSDDEIGASLIVASTPDASVAGQSVNPLSRLSGKDLLERVVQEAGDAEGVDVDDLEVVQRENRQILGVETEVTTFATTTRTNGEEVPVRIHLASVSHEGDVVVLVGVHPEAVDERETQLTLMESAEHEGNADE